MTSEARSRNPAPALTGSVIILEAVVKVCGIGCIHARCVAYAAYSSAGHSLLISAENFREIVVAFLVCGAYGVAGAVVGHRAYVDNF
jgi:hypothetical protein